MDCKLHSHYYHGLQPDNWAHAETNQNRIHKTHFSSAPDCMGPNRDQQVRAISRECHTGDVLGLHKAVTKKKLRKKAHRIAAKVTDAFHSESHSAGKGQGVLRQQGVVCQTEKPDVVGRRAG